MTMHFRNIAEQAAADGAITPREIMGLRQAGWTSGDIDRQEAEALFAVNDRLLERSRQWSDFFVEALGEFILNGAAPKGYVDDAQADWLIGRIDHNGKVDSMTEMDLMVRLFERALNVPDRLREYALGQIEAAVLTGEGPTRCGGALKKGCVTEAEARLMRRIIFSSGSERPAAVSRKEADMLYRIKDAALGSASSPEWKRLFVQGVGNYLMGFAGQAPLSSERAAELESFMDDHRSSVGAFFGRMGKSAVKGKLFKGLRRHEKTVRAGNLAGRADQTREIDTSEKAWLKDRMDGNARIDEFDQALLDFIVEETGQAL